MDFAALQVFKAVADEGGISPAARKLHRVQSNVTTRIQQLEASLGTKLFVRAKHRLHLAPAGEVFLHYAEQMLHLAEAARHAVLGDQPRGVLRVGTLESTAASRLPPLLARYHGKYPAVRVELTTGTTDTLVEAVLGRRLEAAFAADCRAAAPLAALPAFDEELVLIAPRAHPAIRRARDVRADTMIVFPGGCAYRRRLQTWLADDGVVLHRFLELGSYHAIVACVASGAGIALVPRSVLQTVRRREGLSVHRLRVALARSTTSLVWRTGEASPPLQALQAEIAKPGTARRPRGRRTLALP